MSLTGNKNTDAEVGKKTFNEYARLDAEAREKTARLKAEMDKRIEKIIAKKARDTEDQAKAKASTAAACNVSEAPCGPSVAPYLRRAQGHESTAVGAFPDAKAEATDEADARPLGSYINRFLSPSQTYSQF